MRVKVFFQKIFKNFFQIIFKAFYGKITFSKNEKIIFEKFQINEISHKNIRHEINEVLYKIPKARVYTDTVEHVAIIQKNKLIPKVSYQQVDSYLKDESFNTTLKIGTPRVIKKFSGNILSLVQGASGNNYFHFLFDIVVKIELAKRAFTSQKIDYFYLPKKEKWQIDILSELDIQENKIIDSSEYRHVSGDNILALEHPWYKEGLIQEGVNNLPEWIIFFLRERFIDMAKKFDNNELVYIDRSDSINNRCKLINNDEIIDIVEKKGFKSYRVSDLKFFEQIYLFKKAKVILGPHGAAFSNLIFSSKGLKLFEIIPSEHLSLKCKRFSNFLNFDYKRFNLKRVQDKNGDMILDKKILIKILDSI